MQERKWITVLIPAVLLFGITSFASPAAAGSAKVDVCHFPPGNPDNFHTITISEKAFSKHLAHGDLGGPCNALCATICDDENACTIDDTADCEEVGCPAITMPVDCNDDNECTADSCESASGCVNTPLLGEACDDDQVCSGPDTCDDQGACQGPAIADCCLGDEDCSQDLCDQASCNLDTNRCGEDPLVCDPPNLCTVSECASDTGECVEAPVTCPTGACNEATGKCEVTFTPDRDITMLAGFYQNYNYGGCELVAVGGLVQGNGRGGDERVIIGFDVTALSGQFTSIDAITLRLVVAQNASSLNPLVEEVYAVSAANRDWEEGMGPCGGIVPTADGDSTWSKRHTVVAAPSTGTPWAGSAGLGTADIDYVDTLLASREFTPLTGTTPDTLPNIGDTIDFTFTGSSAELKILIDTWLVDNVANSQRNPGLLLLDTNGPDVEAGSVERVVAHSRESTTPALRPQLIVTYTPQP